MRVGVFADLVYRRQDGVVSTDIAFAEFLAGLGAHVQELVVFGRLDPEPGVAPHVLAGANVRFVALPHYRSLRDVRDVARARRKAVATVGAALDGIDVLWLFGPHPLAGPLERLARGQGVPVVLGVRQDLPAYVRGRASGVKRLVAPLAAHALERVFRRLARRVPAVVVGDDLARRYSAGTARVLSVVVSLVRDEDVVNAESALGIDWSGERCALSVGRLDPEKNPLLLADVIAALRRDDPRWWLRVAGSGPLAGALRNRGGAGLELLGYVPYGPDLRQLYRSSHALVHVSFTEGVPQVLVEAMAAGLPIVATAVGGVPGVVGTERGLLVPPDDAVAVAGALRRLADDAALRARVVRAGLDYARDHTLDAEAQRIASFLESATA